MDNRIKLGIMGANGFLGADLYSYFNKNTDYMVTGITKSNYPDNIDKEFDLFINANGNSKRFWANNNVIDDFKASTLTVYKTFFDFNIHRYIYMSSVDVYSDHDNSAKTLEDSQIKPGELCPYGFHKYLSEEMVKKYSPSYLILRCSAIIGQNMKKGLVKDILDENPIFVSSESSLQFINTSEIARVIKVLIENNVHNEIFNVGGIGAVSINKLIKLINKKVSIHPEAKNEVYNMDIAKLKKHFPLKSSEDYIRDLLSRISK